MKYCFADLHIHVGATEGGKWIKIPTSRRLTVRNICEHSLRQKGMDVVGIVDAMSPLVLEDLNSLLAEGLLQELPGGGYQYKQSLTVLLGTEIETIEPQGGMAHTLLFLPDIAAMRRLSNYMSQFIKNINLSAQNAHMPLNQLIDIAVSFEAMIVPAHIFTPYKSMYGVCARRFRALLTEKNMRKLSAVELGLSADSDLADRIGELSSYTFLTNSDAHSLDKIAREYTLFSVEQANFQEIHQAMRRQRGREVIANYGLNPRLGKYHRTLCEKCGHTEQTEKIVSAGVCVNCGSNKVVTGVLDRINDIADYAAPIHPAHRAPYYYQVPLEFISGLGKKGMGKLLDLFGTEMNVLHRANAADLRQAVGDRIADGILSARSGTAIIQSGGGGVYGKVINKVDK